MNNNHIYNPTTDGMSLKELMKRKEIDDMNQVSDEKSIDRKSIDSNKSKDISNYSIKEIANNVNRSLLALDELQTAKKKKRTHTKSNQPPPSPDDHNKPDQCMEDIPSMFFLEPLLLLTLYVVMSQPFVYNFFSQYIKQLQPNENEEVGMSGVIIYGSILTILFIILRKIIHHNI